MKTMFVASLCNEDTTRLLQSKGFGWVTEKAIVCVGTEMACRTYALNELTTLYRESGGILDIIPTDVTEAVVWLENQTGYWLDIMAIPVAE